MTGPEGLRRHCSRASARKMWSFRYAWKQGYELHYKTTQCVWHQFRHTSTGFRRSYVRTIYERNACWGTGCIWIRGASWLRTGSPAREGTGGHARWPVGSLGTLRSTRSIGAKSASSGSACKRGDSGACAKFWKRSPQQLERPGARFLDSNSAPARACPFSPPASAARPSSSQSGQ